MRLLLALALLTPAAARAETEQALSVALGWATFSAPGEAMGNMEPVAVSPTIGGALAAIYERALGTEVMLRGEAVFGLFYGGAEAMQAQTASAVLADAGVAFRFDVLKYVPYGFAGLGAVTSGGGPLDRRTDLVLVIGGGLDWLVSRETSWGIEARLASFGGDLTVFTIGVRGTRRWGFF